MKVCAMALETIIDQFDNERITKGKVYDIISDYNDKTIDVIDNKGNLANLDEDYFNFIDMECEY